MITMDYKDAGAFAVLIFMFVAIFTLIPVLWIGDIGIHLVTTLLENPPRIAYIGVWIIFCGGYYFLFLEGFLANGMLKDFDRASQIIVFYAQGLFFAYILSLNGLAKWSLLPLKIINVTIGGLFGWLFS